MSSSKLPLVPSGSIEMMPAARYNRGRSEYFRSETIIPARSYKIVVSLFVLAMLGAHVFFFWSVRDRIVRGDPDFTVFYTAGQILRQGHAPDLYDARTQGEIQRKFVDNSDIRKGPLPFIHPPFEALIFVPLTYLPYASAFAMWSLLNLALLCAVAHVLRDSVIVLKGISWWEFVLMCLAFFPIFANFHQGQDAILLLLLLALSYRALSRDADALAGAWLALGIFKYHLILPLFFALAIWKGRKFVLGFISVAGLLALLSLGAVGWHGALQYPALAWRVVTRPDLGGIPARQLPNLLGLLAGWPGMESAGWLIQSAVLLFGALLLVAVAFLRRFAVDRKYQGLCVSCAVVVALLVGFSTNTYDLSLLVLPLALVADHVARIAVEDRSARIALRLPVIPLLISPFWFFLWMRWAHINVIAIFLVWWLLAIWHELFRNGVRERAAQVASALT